MDYSRSLSHYDEWHAHMDLETAIAGWLNEKYGTSHSTKTRKAYDDTLSLFRARLQALHLDLDAEPSIIAPAAQSWAGESQQATRVDVAPATYNQRLAILSSFYEYAIRHEVLHYNPIERVKRRKGGKKHAARQIDPAVVKSGLQQIDRSTPEGLRDYALLSVALATGRRVSELAGLRYKHIHKQGDTCVIEWERCKGNKQMIDELKGKATRALYTYLHAVYGPQLASLPGDAAIWISFSPRNSGHAIGIRSIANICEAHLGTSKVHATRHTWAVTMHHQGASLQQIGKGLGHSNLKTTSDYMEEQLGYENPYASALEDAFGI